MSYNPYRANRRKFDVSYTPSTYVGDLKDPIIHAALSAGDTLANNWVKQIDGIHSKTNITTSVVANPIVAAGCDFLDGENVSLSDKTLTLVDLKVNEEICRKTIYPTWQGATGSRASSNMMRQEFVNEVLSHVAAKTAEQVETLLWKGGVGVRGLLSDDGVLDATGFAASSLANATTQTIVAPTATTAIAEFAKVYEKAATTKPAILNKSDLGFYVSPKTYSLFIQQLAGVGGGVSIAYDNASAGSETLATANSQGVGVNALSVNQNFNGVTYLGVPIHRCSGMFDDTIVLGQAENLIFGSNAGTDLTDVKFIPVYEYDGSDNVRVVMQMAFNTIAGVDTDVIVGKV